MKQKKEVNKRLILGGLHWEHDPSDSRVNISWSRLLKTQENKNSISTDSNANYTVFYSNKKEDQSMMQSVCFLVHNTNREFGQTNKTSIKAKMRPNKYYYVNVLANVPYENAKFAYTPTEILFEEGGMSKFVIVLGLILIIFLGYAIYFFYKKYAATKKRLDYEMQDVRNMANVSKSDEQIDDMQKKKQSNKYSTLTEDSNVSKI